MFAKLFGPANDQVLVKLDAQDRIGVPEIRIYFEPPGLGVCSFAISYEDSELGWELAEQAFGRMDEAEARRGIEASKSHFNVDLSKLMPASPIVDAP